MDIQQGRWKQDQDEKFLERAERGLREIIGDPQNPQVRFKGSTIADGDEKPEE